MLQRSIVFLAAILTLSMHGFGQLEDLGFENCQVETFRFNRMVSLLGNEGSLPDARNQLQKDSTLGDRAYYACKALYIHKMHGSERARAFLQNCWNEDHIEAAEAHYIEGLVSLRTNNMLALEDAQHRLNNEFPNSILNLRLRVHEFVAKPSNQQSEPRRNELVQSIDTQLGSGLLNDGNHVFLSLMRLEILRDPLSIKNNKEKKRIKRIAQDYPSEVWTPYVSFILALNSWPADLDEFLPEGPSPNANQRESWTNFYYFLDENPLYDKTKFSKLYHGFPDLYYPIFKPQDEILTSLEVYDRLIAKYPAFIHLKENKLLVLEIFADSLNDSHTSAYAYLSTLVDLCAYHRDHGMSVTSKEVRFTYYTDNEIHTLLSAIEPKKRDILKRQLASIQSAGNANENLVALADIMNRFEED